MKADLQSIINDLYNRNIINNNNPMVEKMSGTTEGLVFLLIDSKASYVLKKDYEAEVNLVNRFLNLYKNIELLPNVLYSDFDNHYYVYSYIKGTTHFNRGLKENWLNELVTGLFNHYISYDDDFWGRFEVPRQSWHEFNKTSIDEARTNVDGILSENDYHLINTIVKELQYKVVEEDRYLLHGDTGVHNFVFNRNSIAGVIDPSPMVGPILYDFIYAFCSSPDDLNIETLLKCYNLLQHNALDQKTLILELIIQLYCRIGISVRHHPQDLPEYLIAWEYWKRLCK